MSNVPTQSDSNQPVADPADTTAAQAGDAVQLERSTYEIIRNRLLAHAETLRSRMADLNDLRREVFGSIPTELIATERITTGNNCVPRDIVAIGKRFIFGYNVHIGLKSETAKSDVFSVYRFEDGVFHEESLDFISGPNLDHDFRQLYRYYKGTSFAKFQVIGPHLYIVFRVGKVVTDIKCFKFLIDGDQLVYIDSRSDHEIVYPPQHDFEWTRTHRELHRSGMHPHISIEDRVFVESVGGDVTIKVEDNTDDGQGIYSEPVDDPDQTLDDAEIFYAIVGNIILLKLKPFREEAYRYFVFNEKTQQVIRLDAIADACVLLPEDHGLIFSKGYYLQSGEYKAFDTEITNLLFEKRIASPNGEDFLYVFYNRAHGEYVLLSYNMIEQQVKPPILCNGFSLFDNGNLVYFRSDETPQKHHALQIWQTPYVGESVQASAQTDSYLYKIGNRDVVRGMAECQEVINLIGKDDSYANLYVDLVKKTTDILDSYFWLKDQQTFNLGETVAEIRAASKAAVDEFDKVVRVRRNTKKQFGATSQLAKDAMSESSRRRHQHIDDFVASLAQLRQVRGAVISLKELKYVDLAAIDKLESDIQEQSERISLQCVEFLLHEDSLQPYVDRVNAQNDSIEGLATNAEARTLGEDIAAGASELEMLIDIVSNLKIDDATQRTRIIDNISTIYSNLNQTRARLKKKSQELMSVEGAAEFNSQIKLLSQAVVNYLDVCDSPERCDEYLTKLMVQVEELEGQFAEFDDFVLQLTEKREEIYAAFDTRKLQLIEARNRRATTMMSAAERILNGIRARVANFESVNDINSYFAADLMIEKIRDIIEKLKELDESVKVDDVESRLKTIREDAVRQLRDKQELYVGGENVIQFGEKNFSVNIQQLDLTTVIKDGQMFYHLSGTNYFERIDDEAFNKTRPVWDQEIVSENRDVYRGEFLAYQMLLAIERGELALPGDIENIEVKSLIKLVQTFMAPRYAEGYIKGVHDHDAALILKELWHLHVTLDLMKYSTGARAIGNVFWTVLDANHTKAAVAEKNRILARFMSLGDVATVFGEAAGRARYVDELNARIAEFVVRTGIATADDSFEAAEYLCDQLARPEHFVCSRAAKKLSDDFHEFIHRNQATQKFELAVSSKALSPADRFLVARDWIGTFVESQSGSDKKNPSREFINEAAAILGLGSERKMMTVDINPVREIKGILGDHPRVESKTYRLDYNHFANRLANFLRNTVPSYEQYVHSKKELVAFRREQLRLEEFKPRVLTSFVRNKLINSVYLPMVGANLAKQIGVVGEGKRTDLMGLLLLVSPPGYGKTTLMEYIANRLGITFMKINGPAIGHQVTSLDPTEAPNASAREEVNKLNLALEMGDNVMIYLDDIQHCNPEFLQKFISLCDATRRIEGVFRGKPRTYDLRGRKVCVVMAGNPYTESGEKFQIPDMLANRADTYNLGDVIGDNAEAFEMSYLENALTSNSTLARLHSQSRTDIYSIIKMAGQDGPQSETLEGNYSVEEINEFVAVMRKMLTVRDILLKVNGLYIDSAAQSDDYRTEPPFKLQGSYRDMNKIAERIVPIMNKQELDTLIFSHFENQAQTLTTGAEANLLRFKKLIGKLEGEELSRWEAITGTFRRNVMLGNVNPDDQFGQVIAQMSTFTGGLSEIRNALQDGVRRLTTAEEKSDSEQLADTVVMRQVGHAVEELAKFNVTLADIKSLIGDNIENEAKASKKSAATEKPRVARDQKIQIINKVPKAFQDVIRNQFRVLQTWMEPILQLIEIIPEAKGLGKAAELTEKNYQTVLRKIEEATRGGALDADENDS